MSRRHPNKPKKNERGNENTHPTIYDRKTILAVVTKMLAVLDDDKKEKIHYLKTLFLQVKPRIRPEYWSKWEKEYKDDDQINQAMREIALILESRCVEGGLTGDLNSNFAKFHMMNNYEWKEKGDQTNRHKGLPSLSRLLAQAADSEKEEK